MFFANHARTVTLLVRGDSLEKSMSQYLIEPVRSKANIRVALNVAATHGEQHLEAIDVADRVAGGSPQARASVFTISLVFQVLP